MSAEHLGLQASDDILIALRRIMRATELYSQQLARDTGLTAPQLLLLQGIEKEGSPSTSTLARHIVVSQATVTRIIDRLERDGLVERGKGSKDKRIVNVSLTERGRRKLAVAPTPLQAEFYQKFRELEDWEQQMLRSALLRIATMMDAEKLDAAAVLVDDALSEPSPY